MKDINYTRTSTFLFPMLNIPKSLFECHVKDVVGRVKFTNRYVNSYVSSNIVDKFKDLTDHLFIVIRDYQDKDFDVFYSTLIAFENYVDDYNYNDFVVFVFKIPFDNLVDYKLINQGKYSQISAQAKKLILTNHFFNGTAFTLPLILNKSGVLKDKWEERLSSPNSIAELKDQEVWPIIEMEEEILTTSTFNTMLIKKKLVQSGEF